MRKLLRFFKNSLHTIGAIVAILVIGAYLSSHYNLSGILTQKMLTENLSEYLGTEVSLDSAKVDIFNQAILENVLIKDQKSDTLLFARRAMVSFDLLPLLLKRLQIHTIQLIDFDITLLKQDSDSDFNFQFIVDVLAPKDKENRRRVLDDININSIILRSGRIKYDDNSKKKRKDFIDPNHLNLTNVSSNLTFSASTDEGLYLKVKRLSFDEKSGLSIAKASTIIQTDAETKKLDLNDIYIAGSQWLGSRYKADAKLTGFASMEKNVLDASIVSFYVKEDNNLDLEMSLLLQDILSTNEEMAFDCKIDKFQISKQLSSFFIDKYLSSQKNNIAPYLNEIDEVLVEGKAIGTINSFNYESKIASFGELSSDFSLSGKYEKEKPLDLDIVAAINNVEINKYHYGNIEIDGNLDTERFDGKIAINDEKCRINSQLCYFYKKNKTRADISAEIGAFEPFTLNFTNLKYLENVSFSGIVNAAMNLKDFKKPLGNLQIDSLELKRAEERYFIPSIKVLGENISETYHASINSPIIKGNYTIEDNLSDLDGDIFESASLSEFLRLPFSINKDIKFKVQLDSLQEIVSAEIIAPEFRYLKNIFDINLHSKQKENFLTHNLDLTYQFGNHTFSSKFDASTTNKPLSVYIKPCEIIFNKDTIKCEGIKIAQREDKAFDISKLELSLNEQKLSAKGEFAEKENFLINVDIKNLQIDTLFTFLPSPYVRFGGEATGNIAVAKDSTIHISSKDLIIKDFSYLNGLLGDTNAKVSYDIDHSELLLDVDIACEDNHSTKIEGYVDCSRHDSLNLHIDANKLRIDFLNTWVGKFLEDFHGDLTGLVHLYGPGNELKLIGEPSIDASFTNNLSGSRFFLKDYVSLYKDEDSDNSHIDLHNAKFLDTFGNEATLNAAINHCHFNHFSYNVNIDLPERNGFLIFDKPTHYNNELYWGQIYGTGNVSFVGKGNKHVINLNCQTVGKSQFNISPGEESYSDKGYNFLTFRDKEVFEASEMHDYSKDFFDFSSVNSTKANPQTVEFDLKAQITENCQVYVQMDPLAEDRLLCKGNGDLSLHYDPKSNYVLSGEYNMTSGGYLVTMKGDLLNKEFKIQEGSKIIFPGSFSNAELTLNANYSIPSVNLKDLDDSFASLASLNRTTFPVDCKLAVTGRISAPQVSFDLEVKNTSDDVQALVHNIIGTPEMLNREVFYLLLFSKFYTPEYASTSQNNSGSELSSFASSSLTSQLNNILGHISDNFTMGTNFRSDKGDFSDLEMDVSLSTRLFDDRLILNGNFGYRDPANRVGLRNNNNSFIGDFDVEYLITRKGTLRAKAYSHYNERDYSINNALTTQGIGFIVRKDYKSFKDLLFWKSDKKKK